MNVADIGATLTTASRLGSSAGVLLHALENRAALAALEIEEAGQRLQYLLLWCAATAAGGLLAGFTLTLAVAAMVWDTPQRVPVLLILGLVEFGAAIALGWVVAIRWREWSVFTALREQLTKDSACLREIMSQPHR